MVIAAGAAILATAPKEPEILRDPPEEPAGESPYREPGKVDPEPEEAPDPWPAEKGGSGRWVDWLKNNRPKCVATDHPAGLFVVDVARRPPGIGAPSMPGAPPLVRGRTEQDESKWMYNENQKGDVPIEARKSF